MITCGAFAQQDPQFSQNMFNRLFYNPGYAGSNGAICGTAFHRQQYTGFAGNPITTSIGIEGSFNVPALYMNQSGAGLYILQDELGAEETFQAKAAYSHRFTFGGVPGFFRVGIEGGIIQKSVSDNWISEDPVNFDPAILNAKVTSFDMGFGVYYHNRNFYVGLSSTHLTAPEFTDNNDRLSKDFFYGMDRHYYVMGGYNYEFNTKTPMELQPSFLVKSTGNVTQADLNVNFLYNKTVWGGISGRQEIGSVSLAAMAGVDLDPVIFQPLKVGMAYDLNLSDINNQVGGGFEIMVNYCYKIIVPPKRQKYRDVIWL